MSQLRLVWHLNHHPNPTIVNQETLRSTNTAKIPNEQAHMLDLIELVAYDEGGNLRNGVFSDFVRLRELDNNFPFIVGNAIQELQNIADKSNELYETTLNLLEQYEELSRELSIGKGNTKKIINFSNACHGNRLKALELIEKFTNLNNKLEESSVLSRLLHLMIVWIKTLAKSKIKKLLCPTQPGLGQSDFD